MSQLLGHSNLLFVALDMNSLKPYNALISCLGLLVYSPHQEKTYFLKFDLHLKTSFQFSKINSHIDVLSSNGKKTLGRHDKNFMLDSKKNL